MICDPLTTETAALIVVCGFAFLAFVVWRFTQ